MKWISNTVDDFNPTTDNHLAHYTLHIHGMAVVLKSAKQK